MKKYSILILFTFAALTNYGQGIVEKYYSDLEAQEKTTSVYVSSAMFEMAAKLDIKTDDKDFNELKEFINSVQSFSLIKVPELEDVKSTFSAGIKKLEHTHEELIRIKDENERLRVYIDEENDIIHELAILGIVNGDFLAASLIGEMDLNQISKFINNVQGDNFEGLSMIKESGVIDMKVFPNPVNKGTDLNIEIPSNLRGGKIKIYSMDGNLVHTTTGYELTHIDTNGFEIGNYIVELSKDESMVRQHFIIVK